MKEILRKRWGLKRCSVAKLIELSKILFPQQYSFIFTNYCEAENLGNNVNEMLMLCPPAAVRPALIAI